MTSRSFGMDVVRSVSIWMVLFAHIAYWFQPEQDGYYYLFVAPLLLGVEPFFVLGGFLAALTFFKVLNRSGHSFPKSAMKDYWYRRWVRTLPNYFLFLVVYFCAFALFKEGFSFDVNYVFFLQNFLWLSPNFFSASWSLATQEWFYFLFPLVLMLFSRVVKGDGVLITCLLFILVCLGARYYFLSIQGFDNLEGFLRRVAMLRLDSIIVGLLVGWFYCRRYLFHRNQKKYFLLGIIGIVVFAYLRRYQGFNSLGLVQMCFYPLFSFCIALTMPYLYEKGGTVNERFNSFVVNTSKWSYSIYLSHVFFKDGIYLIAKKLDLVNDVEIMFVMAVSWVLIVYAVSALVYQKFELPVMRLLGKPQRS